MKSHSFRTVALVETDVLLHSPYDLPDINDCDIRVAQRSFWVEHNLVTIG